MQILFLKIPDFNKHTSKMNYNYSFTLLYKKKSILEPAQNLDGSLGFGIELTLCEVLLGLPTYNNPDLKLTNFLILIGKCFLNNAKK